MEDGDPGVVQSPTIKRRPTPLPKMQIFIVMIIMLAEPISSTVIYPFVNQFVRETGITKGDERKTGYYAGLLESAFFFAECATVFQWGRLSDRIGRRPVVLLGPLGLAIAMFMFGYSKNFWLLLVTRCGQGAFNGNIGVTKSVIAEITDSSNVAQAYAWLPVMWSSGVTAGPMIGGFFAQPAKRWPQLSRFAFLVDHPYFVPCAIAGTLSIASFLMAYVGLKETLQSRVAPKQSENTCRGQVLADEHPPDEESALLQGRNPENYSSGEQHEEFDNDRSPTPSEETEEIPLRALLKRKLLIALANHGFISFLDQAHQTLLPLMYSTSIEFGGLGRDPHDIGMIMGTWGALNAVIQVFYFSKIMEWLGPRKMYIISFGSLLFTFSAFPFLNIFARWTGSMNVMVLMTICFQMAFCTLVFMAYGCTQLFIMDAAPNRNSLGAVNGLGQMMSSVTRTVAPWVASSLFSISLQKQLLGGYFVYAILLLVTSVGVYASFLLPEGLLELS